MPERGISKARSAGPYTPSNLSLPIIHPSISAIREDRLLALQRSLVGSSLWFSGPILHTLKQTGDSLFVSVWFDRFSFVRIYLLLRDPLTKLREKKVTSINLNKDILPLFPVTRIASVETAIHDFLPDTCALPSI